MKPVINDQCPIWFLADSSIHREATPVLREKIFSTKKGVLVVRTKHFKATSQGSSILLLEKVILSAGYAHRYHGLRSLRDRENYFHDRVTFMEDSYKTR